jgi:hypothetical protein
MISGPCYVGNIFVSPQPMEKAGDKIGGHTHYFDHVGFLAAGSVQVTVEGHEPKTFTAPRFVVIRKHTRHSIVALEDNTSWYCVFAVRDIDGETQEIVDGEVDPWFTKVADDFWETRPLTDTISKQDLPFLE